MNMKLIPDKARKRAVDEIVAYFLDEHDMEIGVIAAEDLLDKIMNRTADEIYNKAIADALKLVATKQQDIIVEVDLLKRDTNSN